MRTGVRTKREYALYEQARNQPAHVQVSRVAEYLVRWSRWADVRFPDRQPPYNWKPLEEADAEAPANS